VLRDALWQENLDIAAACLHHPFVRGLAEGSLDSAIFRRYVAQDAFFLHAFARAYALAAARSPDSETLSTFCELLNGVWKELQLHAAYSQELNIDTGEVTPNSATTAYTDFLLATAWHGELGVTIAAMTPCMRLYGYLGHELAKNPRAGNPYQEWIATYSSDDFGALVARLETLLDKLAEDNKAVHKAYRYAMQCELNFFSAVMKENL
jgi:thiaminase (transcriptional activator TenA)